MSFEYQSIGLLFIFSACYNILSHTYVHTRMVFAHALYNNKLRRGFCTLVLFIIIMSLRVYQGCCYVSGYYYAKDRATRSHQTVRARQRCRCLRDMERVSAIFPLPFVFDCLRRVEKKSIVVVASPLVALMKDQVAQCSSCGLAAGFVSTDPNDHSMRL